MCGILSVIGEVQDEIFLNALHLQKHRGPDDWGFEKCDGIMFGHRRLSIIDLNPNAKQPLTNSIGDVIGVFNGEIYNYEEIRSDLISKGYKFNTNGDTEVLLNAFHLYGEKALDKLIGMFAFVIYDKRNKTTYVARDRLGIKPLFYKKTEHGYCFSSEVKSIRSIEQSCCGVDLLSVSAYLSYRYPLIENSFFKGISSLEPGHLLVIKNNQAKKKKYWDCSKFIKEQEHDRGEEYYINKLQEIFASSVKYRMIADVKVGAYLSGGVDSSAVVAEMHSMSKKPIQTFTIGFEDEGYNEFDYSREVAEQYKTEHQEIILSSENYIKNMAHLIDIKDAPLGVPNEVPLYLMSKELKKKVTVVLSGEGADEIFGGYGRIFRSADDYEKLKNSNTRGLANFKNKYGDKKFDTELDHFLFLYQYTNSQEKQDIFSDEVNGLDLDSKLRRPFEEAFAQAGEANYASKMMYVFEKLHLPGLLQRVDATTMATGVEARVPFVDHRLVEFAFTIPEKYKLKWSSETNSAGFEDKLGDEISEKYDIPKYILKKSFEDKLSNNILYRKKMGFPVPLAKFFGEGNKKMLKERLYDGQLVESGIVTRDKIKNYIEPDFSQNSKRAMTCWMLFNLEIFLEGSKNLPSSR